MAEFRFAIESVNHVSVKEIAEDLERSEKAVWDMLTHRGIPAGFQDGYSVREISDEVAHPAAEHSGVGEIRPASQEEEWPDRGGFAAVLPLQPPRAHKLARCSTRTASFWVTELIEAEKIKVNGVWNAVARQLSKRGRVAGGCSFHA